MKIKTIQNTYIEAEIVLADRRLKAGETVQLRCVLDSKLGPVYLTEKLEVDEYKSISNDTYCKWNYVLQEKCILPGTYNFEIVVVQSSGLVIPVSSKAENCLIIVPAERGECFLKPPEKTHIMPFSGDVGTMRVNNPEYVDQMIAVAKSYYIKDAQFFKDTGRHFFNYHQSYTCMDNAFGYQKTKPYIWADREKASDVRRKYSKPIAENNFLDCSSFINLVLRGIPYDCSPYALEKAKREDWDRTVLVANKGVFSWAMNPFEWYMHKAEINPFWDDEDTEYAQTQYSSVRYKQDDRTPEIVTVKTTDEQEKYEYYQKAIPRDSANLGKLLASQGGTVFFKDDFCNVEPGDIILYSSTNPDADPHNDGYKYITHIAICGSKELVAESDSDYERFREYPYKHRIYDATYASGLVSKIKDEKGNTVDYDVPTFIQYIPVADENGNVVDVISERYLELDSEEIVAIVRPDLTGTAWGKKRLYPTLTDTQKKQIQDLIVQYSSVRQTLFYYTGAVRRESYVSPACITNTGYSTDTQLGCVLQFQDDKLDKKIYTDNKTAIPDKENRFYYKYMLNCGLFCQFIWMGRPISDFVSEGEGLALTGKDAYDLLYYVRNKKIAPVYHTLQSEPANISTKINSVFGTGKGETPWGYYFDFEESKRMYKAKNNEGGYYNYNSFFNYKNTPVEVEIQSADEDTHTIVRYFGNAAAHPLTNQVIVNLRFEVSVNDGKTIPANKEFLLATLQNYTPNHQTAIAVHHLNKIFVGRISTNDGKIFVRCTEELTPENFNNDQRYISVNASYFSSALIEPNGEQTPLGFDGAASMAQELYVKGCEIPYSEIDIGDLVFFKSSDISNDFRNKPTDDDNDAMTNRLFRNISHVGIVREFDDKGYPSICDCTNSYEYPIVIGRTSMANTEKFSRVKASYERNNVVMVARHPAAFGLGGNVPAEFEPYRGILV